MSQEARATPGAEGRSAQQGPRSGTAARAAYLLRRRVLDTVGAALDEAGIVALLVKGAGLAETVYPAPWERGMSDIDLLVQAADRPRALEALRRAGALVPPVPPDRRHSIDWLGERAALVPCGPIRWLVELHIGLDKMMQRPIDWRGIHERAAPVPGLPRAFRVPSREDHAMLVALHVALSELVHPRAWDDLERLFAAGLDGEALVSRARVWQLETTLAVVLERFAERRPGRDVGGLLAALGVSVRRRAFARQVFPDVPRAVRADGLGWTLRQAVLHDHPGTWLRGVASYAMARGRDRLPW